MTFRVAFPTASRRKNVRACHYRFADQRVPRSINVLTEMGLENLQSHLSQTLSIQAAYAPLIFLSLSAIIRPPHTSTITSGAWGMRSLKHVNMSITNRVIMIDKH